MELEKLSIRELIARLTVGQFWALLLVIVTLIVGAFGFGYKASTYIAELRESIVELRLNSQKNELEEAKAELVELNEKDKFLSLFLRYEIAKGNWYLDPRARHEIAHLRPDPTRFEEIKRDKEIYGMNAEEQWAEYINARKAFDEYLDELMGRDRLKIRKGQKRLAKVIFKDETKWDIPRELHVTLKK
jgi:hypothetical protein